MWAPGSFVEKAAPGLAEAPEGPCASPWLAPPYPAPFQPRLWHDLSIPFLPSRT